METSLASANFDLSAGEVPEPPRKRQRVASSSHVLAGQTPPDNLMNRKMSHKVWMEDLALKTQLDREARSGILCFVNPTNTGFTGVLKQRYTDFLVNEVDLEGNVVHLTDISFSRQKSLDKPSKFAVVSLSTGILPPTASASSRPQASSTDDQKLEPKIELEVVTPGPALNDKFLDAFKLSAEDATLLDQYFGGQIRAAVVKLYERIVRQPHAKSASLGSVTSEPIIDRELRKKMHQDVRRIFDSKLETSSDSSGVVKISAAFQNNKSKGKHGQRGNYERTQQLHGKLGWEELGGEYLHFSLYKENKDTMEVVSFLSTRLKMKPKQFSFAGTKDRRAVTTQKISVYRLHAEALVKLNPILFGSKTGNFKYEKKPLELGDLMGNEFLITLRDCKFAGTDSADKTDIVTFASNVIGAAVKSMQEHGFINYFGLQRFGTHDTGTDEVGKKILQGDFEGAVNAILTYDEQALSYTLDGEVENQNGKSIPRDDMARAYAIHLFKTTGKSAAALDKMPRRFSAETHIIRHLSKHPRDFIGSLMLLQRNLRLMYVHAYQSLVWNLVASQRWVRFGSNVVKGDLILIDGKAIKNLHRIQDDEVDENGEIVVLPAADDVAVSHDDLYQRARALTDEEADSGKYSIFDIVLPTPGYDIEYPQNEVGNFYKDFMMTERGGGIDPGNMRRTQKDFSLSGSYRKFIARSIGEMSHEVKLYTDAEEQLVETDLDRLVKSDPKIGARDRHNGILRPNSTTPTNQKGVKPSTLGKITRGPAPAPGVNMEQHNAWKAFPSILAEETKEQGAVYVTKNDADTDTPKLTIAQPIYRSTFIETFADGSGRTGNREVIIVPAIGSEEQEEAPNFTKSHEEGSREDEPKNPKFVGGEVVSEENIAETPTLVEKEKKIAVVIKFQLGSSQYATMALRELMKNGGMQYSPDFSKPLAKPQNQPDGDVESSSEALK